MSQKTAKIIVTIEEPTRARIVPRVRALLKRAGVNGAIVLKDSPQGVVQVWMPGDPRPVVGRLRKLCFDDPEAFRGTHRWIPVESWTGTDARDLAAYAQRFNRELRPEDTWKIEVRKHHANLSSHELIDSMAPLIEAPNVDLRHPDRILLVNVFGDQLGIANLHQDEMFEAPPTTSGAPRGPAVPGAGLDLA